MSRRVQWSAFGAVALVVLVVLAGCGHYWLAEREPWRRDAEVACLNSGAVKESPARVRINAITGPGICGADFPLRVSALGDSAPLAYDDEALRPPGSIPSSQAQPRWPLVQSRPLPPPPGASPPPYQTTPQYGTRPQYGEPPYSVSRRAVTPIDEMPSGSQQAAAAPGARPLSINPPGSADADEDVGNVLPGTPLPGYGNPAPSASPAYLQQTYRAPAYPPPGYTSGRYPSPASAPPRNSPQGSPSQGYPSQGYPSRAQLPPPPDAEQFVPLGPPGAPFVTGTVGPVEVKPVATLACPLVSALDTWISTSVQPSAMRWFRQPVVEIKQISAYSCRGMNGNPNAHISEHAFGNALDISEFTLADGHRISVQYGWRGMPEEQGFLHDVQAAACAQFNTVLAPGANIYHYNHIHVDLMRRSSRRHICQPAAIPGEVVAERARARYAAQRDRAPDTTGSIKSRIYRVLGYSGEDDERLPAAVPGDD